MRNKTLIRVFAIIALLAFVAVSVITVFPFGANAMTEAEAQRKKEEAKRN